MPRKGCLMYLTVLKEWLTGFPGSISEPIHMSFGTDQGVVALLISLPEKMDSAGISAPESTPNRVCTS